MPLKIAFLWPNLLTLGASASALLAMGWAYYDKSREAAYFFLISGILDALDGPLAKKLNVQSRFGTFFDAMSDFLAFGVAPSLCLVFLDLLNPWFAVLYILAIQFRLTRYASQEASLNSERFFRGLSAPDCVYVGIIIGFFFKGNFNIGFLIASLLAVYPGKFWPKGYRIPKVILGVITVGLFIYGPF